MVGLGLSNHGMHKLRSRELMTLVGTFLVPRRGVLERFKRFLFVCLKSFVIFSVCFCYCILETPRDNINCANQDKPISASVPLFAKFLGEKKTK